MGPRPYPVHCWAPHSYCPLGLVLPSYSHTHTHTHAHAHTQTHAHDPLNRKYLSKFELFTRTQFAYVGLLKSTFPAPPHTDRWALFSVSAAVFVALYSLLPHKVYFPSFIFFFLRLTFPSLSSSFILSFLSYLSLPLFLLSSLFFFLTFPTKCLVWLHIDMYTQELRFIFPVLPVLNATDTQCTQTHIQM
jgi:hypothetical protein